MNLKMLHNIIFVKIIIVGLKNQNWYPKLNVPYFWNNYTIYIYIYTRPKSVPKGVTVVCFHPFGWKGMNFFPTHEL
jgi:hypothetical protein